MSWGFAESIVFAAIMTLRDMSKEEEKKRRLIKTQKFYQECYERIANDSRRVFDVVMKVAQKASKCYTPSELATGTTYLPLYCFSLIIEKQGGLTHEQSKVLNIFFDNMTYPFSQNVYLNAVKTASEISDFRRIITLSKSQAGSFWVNFFRALYKAGTQQDFQEVIDCATSIIMRFAVLGNPNSNISLDISKQFVESANWQINQVRTIGLKEIDWLGVVPISDRLYEMRKFYVELIDSTDITEEITREELIPLIDELLLRCICDIVMMTKQTNTVKMKMLDEAVKFAQLKTNFVPEQYVKEIANNTEVGQFSNMMFSCGEKASTFWAVLLTMGGKADKTDEAIAVTNDVLSILLQVENFLAEKYHFLGNESIAKKYMMHVMGTLSKLCEEAEG